jgi:3',5'-cyclic AMP phosphodiesterase CpdA
VRLAHISDLHLLSLDGSRWRDFANKRFAGGFNILLNRGREHQTHVFDALVDDLNAQGIDHVACTGDITNLSLESEFRFARDRFLRLQAGPANVTCVPGNHDTYIAESAGRFEAVFAPYCAPDDDWRWPDGDAGDPWPLVRVRGDLALIGLSTSRASGWLMGHGTVGREQLARLERALGDPRLGDKLRVVLMHHPAAGRHARSRRRGLLDHPELAEVVGRAGCELVLHGHEHLDLRAELLGPEGRPIPVLGIQSGTYALASPRRRARYRVFEVARRGGARPEVVSIELRRWHGPDAGFGADTAAASSA